MQEATGQAGLMNIMLTIIGIIIILLAGSIAYSKAFRVKNRIIDIIEKHNEYNSDSKTEIEAELTNIGYRTMPNAKQADYCPSDKFKDAGFVKANLTPNHLYCVYVNKNDTEGTYYYKVLAFMYFDLPVIGNYIQIPVTGETKILYTKNVEDWKTVH